MFIVRRQDHNPIITPDWHRPWAARAVFNWCPWSEPNQTHVVYRAEANVDPLTEMEVGMSTIGYAQSRDGIHYTDHRQLITPQEPWEKYGCEDPRITRIAGNYLIFYTALGDYPFSAKGIKVAVALTDNLKEIQARHLVTPFNAKAMVMFPDRIGGKMMALLTVNTDDPPASVALASFDNLSDIWSTAKWLQWYKYLEQSELDLHREPGDHCEVGAPPIKTKAGWLVIYARIKHYFSEDRIFGVEAVLLDLKDPRQVIARTQYPLLVPQALYEKNGQMPNIIFPSGALSKRKKIQIFYGGADTVCCQAEVETDHLLTAMAAKPGQDFMKRSAENPILAPIKDHAWESKAVFNPAAIAAGGRYHLLYRAMSEDDTSVIGYASSPDGENFDQRLPKPVYLPRESFEIKGADNVGSGCEDARMVLVEDKIFMTYTAYNGVSDPRVAITSIKIDDFINHRWDWAKPYLISPPGIMDKNTCIMPTRIDGRYMMLHRINVNICGEYIDSLDFSQEKLEHCIEIMRPRRGMWDSLKIGISAPPIKTKAGWLLLYHGIGEDHAYRVGAALLDLEHPATVLSRTNTPLLEPIESYEKEGQVNNVVFPCGAVEIGGEIYVYYGGADSYVGLAKFNLKDLLKILTA